jgi:hypothetical protein
MELYQPKQIRLSDAYIKSYEFYQPPWRPNEL